MFENLVKNDPEMLSRGRIVPERIILGKNGPEINCAERKCPRESSRRDSSSLSRVEIIIERIVSGKDFF